jgi:hypothetical protein
MSRTTCGRGDWSASSKAMLCLRLRPWRCSARNGARAARTERLLAALRRSLDPLPWREHRHPADMARADRPRPRTTTQAQASPPRDRPVSGRSVSPATVASDRRNSMSGAINLWGRPTPERATKRQDASRDGNGPIRTSRPLASSESISGERPSASPAPSRAAAMTWLKLAYRITRDPTSPGRSSSEAQLFQSNSGLPSHSSCRRRCRRNESDVTGPRSGLHTGKTCSANRTTSSLRICLAGA